MLNESQPNRYQDYRHKVELQADREVAVGDPLVERSKKGRWKLTPEGRARAAKIAHDILPTDINGDWSGARVEVKNELEARLKDDKSEFARLAKRSVESRLRFVDKAVAIDEVYAGSSFLGEIVSTVEKSYSGNQKTVAVAHALTSIRNYQKGRDVVLVELGESGSVDAKVNCDKEAARVVKEYFNPGKVDPGHADFSVGRTVNLVKKAAVWDTLEAPVAYKDQLRDWILEIPHESVTVRETDVTEVVNNTNLPSRRRFLMEMGLAGGAVAGSLIWLAIEKGIFKAQQLVAEATQAATKPVLVEVEKLVPTKEVEKEPEETATPEAKKIEPEKIVKEEEKSAARSFVLDGGDLTHNFGWIRGKNTLEGKVLPQINRDGFPHWWTALFEDIQGALSYENIRLMFERGMAMEVFEKYNDLFKNWKQNAGNYAGTAAETGGRTAIFCHSGSIDGAPRPNDYVRELDDKDIGSYEGIEMMDGDGNLVTKFMRLVKVTRVRVEKLKNAIGVPGDTSIPARIDLEKMDVSMKPLQDCPGVDKYVCGGKSYFDMKNVRTIASYVLAEDYESTMAALGVDILTKEEIQNVESLTGRKFGE
jgi:hypothetical protein